MMGLGNADWRGTFYASVVVTHSITPGNSFGGGRLYMDASRSSSCYGNYTEVNPLYLSCRFYLKY